MKKAAKINSAPPAPAFYLPRFVWGDLDGFFGLFVDNLLQLLLAGVLCRYACGLPAEFVTARILPGAALSILVGNLFYAWQARQLAKKEHRKNVTALPFGINTVSLLAFIFLVMSPVYYETGDADFAWKVGLAACFLSGLLEIAGAFFADWLRRHTPRAALLSGLAGVALSFMMLGFSIQIFSAPAVAVVPFMLVLAFYGSRLDLPGRLPGGLAALLIGGAVAWILKGLGLSDFMLSHEPLTLGWNWPHPALKELMAVVLHPRGLAYVAVVAPMALFNVISSIQNLESAEAAGDRFPAKRSLLVNGGTSLLASALGSPFPTTIYMGHPGWKAMGARSGYSVLNGMVIMLLCLVGGIEVVLKIVPIEATVGILIWIGLVIVAQAFQETERRHTIAVVIGLIPPLAAWVLHIVETTLRSAGTNLYEAFEQLRGELYVEGIIGLYQGFLLISIIFSAIMTHLIDHRFKKAAIWSFVAAGLSAVGLIHAYRLTPAGIQSAFGLVAAPIHTFAYTLLGLIFLALEKARFPVRDAD